MNKKRNKRNVIFTSLYIFISLMCLFLKYYSSKLLPGSSVSLSFIALCIYIFTIPILIALIIKERRK